VTELLGLTIHDPDVALTDLGLALLGGSLGWLLWRTPDRSAFRKNGAVLLAGLANAALWGGIFHAFFPAGTATAPGFLAWVPVTLSIAVAAAAMLDLSLRLLLPGIASRIQRSLLAAYGIAFVVIVLFIRESFSTIVYFYTPVLLVLLFAAVRQAIRGRDSGWTFISTGLAVSMVAAVLQQAKVAVHPTYFDHNAVYHVVQALALLILYVGWRRATLPLRHDRAHL
jgi:lysylphosphatidylglycerol synthetase-like protein (DUF2156 family)